MSIRAMTAVWEHSQHQDTKLTLMLALADSANDDGDAWPSLLGLARKIRRSERQTRYLLRQLEASGEITTRREAGPRGKNIYHLNLPGAALDRPAKPAPRQRPLPPTGAAAPAPKPSVVVGPDSLSEPEIPSTTTTELESGAATLAPQEQPNLPPTDLADPAVAALLADWEAYGVAGAWLAPTAASILRRPDHAAELADLLGYFTAWNDYAAADRRLTPAWIAAQLKDLAARSPDAPRAFRWLDHAPPPPARPEYWRKYTAATDPYSLQAQMADPHSLLAQLLHTEPPP